MSLVHDFRPVVVGVSGGSGSGKTTFCRQLVATLGEENVLHLKQDNYYRDLSHLSPLERDAVNFDHPQALEFELLSTHLTQLVRGHTVAVPVYDFTTHTRLPHSVPLSPRPVVLIEGILIFSQPVIFEQLTYSFFVDACQDVRLERRIRRDVSERGRTPENVRAQFFSTVAPMHNLFVEPLKAKARVVVSGELPFQDKIEQLVQELSDLAVK